jgi:sensor histidine kinase regulating citrate/malate metabolism
MDSTTLANILDNCIQNAIKAMRKIENKELTIKLLKGDPRIFIEVSDNGQGIPKEKFQQIFENGYSTSNSTGYGLFYSKEMLTKYGGRIYVKSSIPNKKTTLVIELQKGEHHEATDPDH